MEESYRDIEQFNEMRLEAMNKEQMVVRDDSPEKTAAILAAIAESTYSQFPEKK
ncbi:hypothetical protein Dalk_4562 [Desulfatibacillum aliphaticivorans]|uniref:Uncharacterized protein n=1 Tax=Desulfatibacillum aliphaticivorans TaxID=218208 RepID=B8FCS7_DESAL|nr:hypothetical protein [Desulfatibacillum aliphaticivorans]ACL06240.1 hypothetical protein Dalk_4562 [Desulfatibacillum aliphaticivorans]